MIRLVSFLFLLLFIISCKPDDGYTMKVSIRGVEDGKKVTLKKIENRKPIDVDSTVVISGKFELKGKVDSPDVYFLFVEGQRRSLPLILENKTIRIEAYKDSLSASKVVGSYENDLVRDFSDGIRTYMNEERVLFKEMTEARKNKDSAFMMSFAEKRADIGKRRKAFSVDFTKQSNSSVFGLIMLENLMASGQLSVAETQEVFETFSDRVTGSAPGKRIKADIDRLLSTQIGGIAPDFSGPDPEGNSIKLTDIKSKVKIVSFWAAWCRPCRLENPNLVSIYKDYHDKGLEIIGISLDGDARQEDPKQDWIKAIEDDGIVWPQLSNLKYFDCPIAKAYDVKGIPANFILDSEGKILAKNLKGEELRKKIAELLDD